MARTEVQKCMDWLFAQQGEMECGSLGQGQFAVLEELAKQKSKVKAISNFRVDVDKALQSEGVSGDAALQLDGNYNSVKALSEKRSSCLDVLSQIVSLEDLVQDLSGEFDSRAVHLVNMSDVNKQRAGPTQTNESMAQAAQNCINSVKRNWRWVFQVMQCAEVHLRNAAAYQEFFQEVDEAEYWMNTTLSRIHMSFDSTKLNGNRADAETILGEVRDVLAAYLQWQTKIDYLFDRAKEVCPVPQRVIPVTEPKPVLALTDFSNSEIEFMEGEALTLLENKDKKKWRVQNSRGQVGMVPAVIILIPAPSGAALDAAIKLRIQLLALWTGSVKRLGYQMIAFMLLVFRDWDDQEVLLLQTMSDSDREELMRILSVIELTLTKNWAEYGDFQELQERITRLKMILEGAPAINGHAQDGGQLVSSVVIQIKMLEALLNKYKDFWAFWETFKSVVEMLRQPRFMLVCDKWEQLRFVTTAHFVRFWDTQLQLGDQEEMIHAQKSLAIHEAPQEEMVSSEITVQEEKKELTTDTVTSTLSEEQHTFIITGVLDPRDNSTKLTLDEAIQAGIVDQEKNTYVNPKTRTTMSMSDAMNEGRVIMEFVSRKMIREEKKSYGLITIKTTKENRPYTIKAVMDPATDKRLTVAEASRKNILDTHNSVYTTETGEKISIADAIHSGLVIVEYHEGEEHAEPEVVTKTYAVHGVVDQKKKAKVSFADAVRDGLLDRDSGEYKNNKTGETVDVQDAIMKGFIKARVISDPSKLEINPENTIIVEKLSNAKQKLMKSMRAMKAFKTAAKH